MSIKKFIASLTALLVVASFAAPAKASEYQADTVEKVAVINNATTFAGQMKAWNGKLYVNAGELYEFDGTNMTLVQDYNPGSSTSNPGLDDAVEFQGKLFFGAKTGTLDEEPVAFDPSAQTPIVRVADIYFGTSASFPREFTVFNSNLYFVARDATSNFELWKYDGTNPPSQVMDLNPGTGNSLMGNLTVFGTRLYFTATNGTTEQIWSIDTSDNLRQETSLAVSNPANTTADIDEIAVIGNKFIFSANVAGDREPYVFDPQTQVASLLTDINPSSSSYPGGFTLFRGEIVFTADDGSNGYQLFAYDGLSTPQRVSSSLIGNPAEFNRPYYFNVFQNKLYFAGYSVATAQGVNPEVELWAYEGFGEPYEVFGFGAGVELDPRYFAEYNSKLYFSGLDNPHIVGTRPAYSITQGAALRLGLSYQSSTVPMTVGTPISPLSPIVMGVSVDFFATSPALPTGLVLNPVTGVISGTPTTAGTTNISVTVTALNGSSDSYLITMIVAGPCGVGTYSQTGMTPCQQADPGYFVANTGATGQTLCPAGLTSQAGAQSCYAIAQYTGPVITSVSPNPVMPGSEVMVLGSRLVGINYFIVSDLRAPTKCSEKLCTFTVPESVSTGTQDLVAEGDFGKLVLQGGITVSPSNANAASRVFKGYTKRVSGGQVKFYAKGQTGAGKVQFFVDGREIAWINDVDGRDPKLRFANGASYLVRSVALNPGKNRFEIRLAGVKVWRATYTPSQ